MADDIVDLTLDDSSDDEVAQRPAKRSRPLVPEADGSDEVILVEDACEASPATEAAAAGTGGLQDGEELRITDSSLEVRSLKQHTQPRPKLLRTGGRSAVPLSSTPWNSFLGTKGHIFYKPSCRYS